MREGWMPNRRRDDERDSFADIVRAEWARPLTDPLDGRARNRLNARELWDDQGRRWTMRGEISPMVAE